VILVLPTEISQASELDHVTYTACIFSSPNTPDERASPAIQPEPARAPAPVDELEPRISISSVVGQPHPGSDAERIMYELICSDPELGALFSFNQHIKTRYNTSPRVDLLWRPGRLVIEIDGQEHTGLLTFIRDRRRDFELFMSGYRVIRFTRFKVLESPDHVLNDIRDAVRYLDAPETQA